MSDMTCDQLDELAAELALGILPVFERAMAQEHLAGCARCRERVRQYSVMGDGLLELVPKSEPPVDLESRLMRRLLAAQAGAESSAQPGAPPAGLVSSPAWNPEWTPAWTPGRSPAHGRPSSPKPVPAFARRVWRRRPRARWPRAVLASAAAVLIALGGWAVGNTSNGTATQLVSAALTTPTHAQAGTVYLYTGTPGWMYLKIHIAAGDQPGPQTVSCQMELRDGTYVTDGTFQIRNGDGFWGSPLWVPLSDVVGARLVTGDGRTIASASLG